MGIYSIKPKFQKVLRPLELFLIRNKVHPTTINLVAFFLSLAGGVSLYLAELNIWLLLYLPLMSFFRTALNALDGMVARSLNVKNQGFGEVLNEFLDRASDASIFFGLALASYTNLALGALVTIIILLNSYLSIVSKAAGGSRQYGGIIGKADRMIYVGILAVAILVTKDFNLANYFLYFIGIGTLITLIQRFLSIKAELYK